MGSHGQGGGHEWTRGVTRSLGAIKRTAKNSAREDRGGRAIDMGNAEDRHGNVGDLQAS